MKEVLLYGQIYSWTAESFIQAVNDILEKDAKAELRVRINSNGGDVDYAWGAVNKFAQFPNKKEVFVDSKAHSMGLYYCCYAEYVEAADYANFILHRASYPSWIETNEAYFTEDRQALLDDANKKLRAAFEAKVDVAKFEKITGHTLDEVFSMEGVLDVPLTAIQAKKIGLVDKLVQITPERKAAVEAKLIEITATRNGVSIEALATIAAKTTPEEKPSKKHSMTLAELKAEHPALFLEVKEIGAKEAATQVTENAQAWLHFYEADKKAVTEGIASGKPMTQLQIIELSEKKQAKKLIAGAEEDSTNDGLNTGAAASSEKDKDTKEKETFVASVMGHSQYLNDTTKKAEAKK